MPEGGPLRYITQVAQNAPNSHRLTCSRSPWRGRGHMSCAHLIEQNRPRTRSPAKRRRKPDSSPAKRHGREESREDAGDRLSVARRSHAGQGIRQRRERGFRRAKAAHRALAAAFQRERGESARVWRPGATRGEPYRRWSIRNAWDRPMIPSMPTPNSSRQRTLGLARQCHRVQRHTSEQRADARSGARWLRQPPHWQSARDPAEARLARGHKARSILIARSRLITTGSLTAFHGLPAK
jgi:hypothetical protein